MASINCTNTLWYSPTVLEESCHLQQLISIGGSDVDGKQHLDGRAAERLDTYAHSADADSKQMADGPVLTPGGQLP